jgi:phosphatidylserine/phosphatidylglycerophosphate/cardiolipin synthase-like enzyme
MAALKKASARLDKMMSAFLSQAEEDRQSLERTNNSNMQSFERMDAHFKQIMDILKEEKCQGQLVANSNEYYMEKECTYCNTQGFNRIIKTTLV